MSLLASRPPAAKFPEIGAIVKGTLTKDSEEGQQRDFDTNDLLFWDDGNPRMQLVIEVATGVLDPTNPDDDGERTFYAKGDMLRAIKDAKRRAKLRGDVIPAGSELTVELIDEEPPPRGKRGFPKKIYSAELVPPTVEATPEQAKPGVEKLKTQHARNDAAKKSARPAARAADDEPPF